jgi:hypothetical protein
MRAPAALALLVAVAGCGGISGPGALRFANAPPVALVNDRRPIEQPKERSPGITEYYFRLDVVRPLERALEVGPARRAANVNSLGEVPDSTWFTNRIGVRPVSPAAIRRGPGDGGPDVSRPLSVEGIKVGGSAIGFTAKDARGDTYIIKLDEAGHAETESSADVIVQRLFWAFGYNVPENHVIELRRDQLELAADATMSDMTGKSERPMTEDDLDHYLALVDAGEGVYRVLASRYIDGEPIGGIAAEGTRAGDPNDTVPHQLRRELRGMKVLAAWVNHTDLKTHNSLVSYDPEGRYLIRYFLDFGKSLGTWARIEGRLYMGQRDRWGFEAAARSLFSLGLWVPPWERRVEYPDYRGLGYFDAESLDPDRWSQHHRWPPFDQSDRFDHYWAAKILLAFRPAHIRAAVGAGRYSDPRTAAWVSRVLIERRRKLLRWAFSRVAPLDRFSVRDRRGGFALCFEDLWVVAGLGEPLDEIEAESHDFAGRALGEIELEDEGLGRGARHCLGPIRAGAGRDSYTIVELEGERAGVELLPLYVHVARSRGGGFRVIGVDRR